MIPPKFAEKLAEIEKLPRGFERASAVEDLWNLAEDWFFDELADLYPNECDALNAYCQHFAKRAGL